MVSAVLFDIDGTLVDSVDLHAEAWREAMLRYGKDVPAEKLRWDIGKGADQLLPSYFSEEELSRIEEELTRQRSDLYMEKYFPQVRPFPAVKALFARLKADGKRIVLASSANEKELKALLDLTGVKEFVEGTTSSDDAEKSKPHPDIFEAALDKLGGVDLREVVVIGDTAHDAEAAGKLGLRTIGVRTGGWSDERLLEAGCAVIYDGPEDLLANYEAWTLSVEERISQPT
ncbi:HAD family hydrolase [Chondromyces apiculatus]|uniref:HAD-superfamily hydrolase, subfamily IA, variant 1 n=1 Tax=Chondromyces apiculatus DSM 436 TaxID=1192034 RepID=A0A017TGF7_9BACT|nr:HAD family hydrolase [Chondromyces apiculatus]EYF07671.1 HAD-superfamily hydrolase, subfamily IA, variant 1 [Chondromyces apiculatus DSM 436]